MQPRQDITMTESGELPVGYTNPKDKDLENRERGIASYYKHNMRKIFRRTGKVLTWMLRQLPKEKKHFTLHKLHQLKDKVEEAQTILRSRYGRKTKLKMICSDV